MICCSCCRFVVGSSSSPGDLALFLAVVVGVPKTSLSQSIIGTVEECCREELVSCAVVAAAASVGDGDSILLSIPSNKADDDARGDVSDLSSSSIVGFGGGFCGGMVEGGVMFEVLSTSDIWVSLGLEKNR